MRLFDMDSKEDYLLDGKYKVATPYAPLVDAVKVVRCKDCEDSRVYGKTTQWLACESVMEGQATDPDGYCYLGKRREGSEVEE